MKILYLIDGMFNSAGRERVVANKAMYLSQLGHEVTILTTDQNQRPSYYPIPSCVKQFDLGINFADYADFNILKRIYSFKKKENIFRSKIANYLQNHPQDIVVTLVERFIPSLIRLKNKPVIIYECHFNKFAYAEMQKKFNKNIINQLIYRIRNVYISKKYFNKLDAFVVLTNEDKAYWGNVHKNIISIPNSITYESDKRALLSNKIVISVGRLSYQKGYERLIEAWNLVNKKVSDWELHIYGEGEDKTILEDLINKYNLNNRIKIYPPTLEIQDKIAESSIYVLSSRFEGLPMVLLESMALGVPIISYDCKTGPKDLITHGENGYLVPEGDIELLSEYIIKLINSYELRLNLGDNAKKTAKEYSHDSIALQWISLFSELIENKSKK